MSGWKSIGKLIEQYRIMAGLTQAELAAQIGVFLRNRPYTSSYASKWENDQDISDAHHEGLYQFFESELGRKFDGKEFREAFHRYEGRPSGDASQDKGRNQEKSQGTGAEKSEALKRQANQGEDTGQKEGQQSDGGAQTGSSNPGARGDPNSGGTGAFAGGGHSRTDSESHRQARRGDTDMNNQDPMSDMDRRSTQAVRRLLILVVAVIAIVGVVAAILYVGRGMFDFVGGQMAEQDIAREATRRSFATVTKEALELDVRLTSEALSKKKELELQGAEATVVAIAALATSISAISQATIAAQSSLEASEKATKVAVSQAISEAFETTVAANRTETAMVRIMTAEADTPTPTPSITPTFTPVPTSTPAPTATPTPTWTQQPTYTPSPSPLPSNTPTNTPEPTQTPYPTSTRTNTPTRTPIPTNTPTPTNTPIPQTDSNSVLEYGEVWHENGLSMWIEITTLLMDTVYGRVYIKNETDEVILIGFDCDPENNITIRLLGDGKDLLGRSRYCRVNGRVGPGDTIMVYNNVGESFLFRGSINILSYDYIVIEVLSFSRIKRARWRIDVPK